MQPGHVLRAMRPRILQRCQRYLSTFRSNPIRVLHTGSMRDKNGIRCFVGSGLRWRQTEVRRVPQIEASMEHDGTNSIVVPPTQLLRTVREYQEKYSQCVLLVRVG